MYVFNELQKQKGTISSTVGKKLAEEVLAGRLDILDEAIKLVTYKLDDKNERSTRSGASKIVEIVAEKKPELVAPYLLKIFPALEATEPQTRWMVIRIMGFCTKLDPKTAIKAVPYAEKYILEKQPGQLCLVSSADLFLADYGILSKAATQKVFPILEKSCKNVLINEHDWLLEAFTKIMNNLTSEQKAKVSAFAQKYVRFPRKSTQKRASILLQKIN